MAPEELGLGVALLSGEWRQGWRGTPGSCWGVDAQLCCTWEHGPLQRTQHRAAWDPSNRGER